MTRWEIACFLMIVSLGCFLYHILKWNSQKRKIGKVKCAWSTRLNPRIPGNRTYLFLLLIFLTISIGIILFPSGATADYRMLAFLFFILSFAPRWNAAVGSSAMILGMKIIRNEKTLSRKIVVKGRARYLAVQWSAAEDKAVVKDIIIPIPGCLSKDLQDVFDAPEA